MIKSNLQRIQRAALFTEQMCQALRQEFHGVWAKEDRDEAEAELVRRVELLDAKVHDARALLLQLNGKQPPEQLKLLLGFDLKGITDAAQGMEGLAENFRQSRQAEQPEPAAAPETGSGLMGKLMRWASSPTVTQRLNPVETRAAGTTPLQADPHQQEKQAFEGAFKLVSGVLTYVQPRLLLVKVSFQALGLPGRKAPWEAASKKLMPTGVEAGVPREQALWLAKVAKALYADDRAVQRGHMALVQWEEAQAMHQEATLLKMSLQTAPIEKVGAMLRSFNLGKFRAAVYQLSHLHVSFKGLPVLEDLFPEPADAPALARPVASA